MPGKTSLSVHFKFLSHLPWVSIVLLAPMVIWGIFGPWLWPHDPTTSDLALALKPGFWAHGAGTDHLLGTDQFGRDLFSRIIEGARVALTISVLGVVLAAVIGVSAGLAAGYFAGIVDNVIMRIVDVAMSIPAILLTILFGAAFGPGVVTIIVAIVLTFASQYARVIRSETLSLKERGFVALAKVANCNHWRILSRHIFPNILATIVVIVTLQLGRAIILEAAITFIGLGVQPPGSAWGLMISEGKSFLTTAWWLPTFPGLAISITVMGANMLGDWLRDALDPRLR
jgi:peptide/nickel transport system permease protein